MERESRMENNLHTYTVLAVAINPSTEEEIVAFKEEGDNRTLFLPKEEFEKIFLIDIDTMRE